MVVPCDGVLDSFSLYAAVFIAGNEKKIHGTMHFVISCALGLPAGGSETSLANLLRLTWREWLHLTGKRT